MRIKTSTLIIILIGILIAVSYQFISALDAPHNASNNVNCGNCHGQTLLNSPFWTDSDDYNIICQICHTAPFGPYSQLIAPYTETHAGRQCRDCHNPHYQRQKMYKNTDASNLYLATGTITSSTCNCDGTYNEYGEYNNDGTSILTYNSITYKSGWDAAKLIDKTEKGGSDKRSAILFPNVGKLGYNYPITAVDIPSANTIKVKGNVTESLCPQTPPCPVPNIPYSCNLSTPKTFAAIYGQYIKDYIDGSLIWEDIEITLGSGMDGPITISSEKNINTDIIASGRSYPDGVNWQITDDLPSGQTTISSGISRPDGFAVGDEIIIINLKGSTIDYSNVGMYELKIITAIPDFETLTVDSDLTNSYDGTTQKIMVQRVPNYTDVTIETGGLLTCNAWYGTTGGVLAFRANGIVTVNADNGISASGKGFRGGLGVAQNLNAYGGETYNGTGGAGGAYGTSGQSGQGGGGGAGGYNGGSGAPGSIGGGGGGGGATSWGPPGGGGGGSYSSLGGGGAGAGIGESGFAGNGIIGGAGGNNNAGAYEGGGGGGGGIYGISDLSSRLYLGSGGGAGGGQSDYNVSNGGNGGNGGGIIYIFANIINISSGCSITSDGNNGANGPIPDCYGSSAGGGGGAGGSIAVFFNNQLNNLGSINANGGAGGFFFKCTTCFGGSCSIYSPLSSGGTGGDGRSSSYFVLTKAQVKFFDSTGANSFADGDSTYNSMCEVCHTQTNHFRNDGGATDQNHTNLGGNIPGSNCTECHPHEVGFFETSSGCLECHSASQGGRIAITPQFNANSHHIQGATVTDSHCYRCHWEANSDGSINNDYHEGFNTVTRERIPDEKVDLVIYGAGTRPTTYTADTTAVQYTANGTRSEIKKINTHCLGCHNDQNDLTTPFGDGKTPKQYAWDGRSISSRYSQEGTLIGLRWNPSVSKEEFGVINTTTGNFIVKGTVGDMEAWTPPSIISGNNLYVSGTNSSAQNKLYILNTTTGSLISAVNLSTDGLILSGVNGSGNLIAMRWNPSVSKEEFGVINTTTGNFIVKGTVGDMEAWTPPSIISGNNLYVSGISSTNEDKLYTLDTNTGSLISSVNLSTDGLILSGFDHGWSLIAIRWNPSASKYEFGVINRTTGNFTVRGTAGDMETWSPVSIISGNTLYMNGTNSSAQNKLYILNTTTGSLISAVNLSTDGLVLSGYGCISNSITTWGKYTGGSFTPKNTQTKAYSAHGNAANNQGGWDLSETWSNTRAGSENIACFDCHNSHGSSVSGTTASYTSTTTNGGIIKDTIAGKGGYSMTYKPQAGGLESNKNAYNAGAGLCFDCHLTPSSSITPWGYNSTFGATQAIMGYWDTQYFGPGTFASKQRFNYKATPHQGGHFGLSSALSSSAVHNINGLCTPCHDPHGVSPTLGANMQYSVPLLKGTWLTSLYREDYTPVNDLPGTIRTDRGKEGVHYRIDQNTFSSDINSVVTGITQTESQFAGLCLNCHPKNSLTGVTHTWKSKERVHESVKGWKTANSTIKHNYPCSKCHTPHNSRLPRLMVTNCLDSRHKGLKTNNTNPKTSGYSSGSSYNRLPVTCSGYAVSLGFCPSGSYPEPGHDCRQGGNSGSSWGSGSKPGNWVSGVCGEPIPSHTVTCHESYDSNQYWNSKTPWTQ